MSLFPVNKFSINVINRSFPGREVNLKLKKSTIYLRSMKKHQTTMELNLTVEYVHVIEIRGLGIKDFLIDVIRSCRGCLCFPSYIQLSE